MKKLILVLFILTNVNAFAQKKTNRHSPIVQKGVFISFNPHSILEPQQGAVGLGVGYRITNSFEVWTEGSYLYKGLGTSTFNFNNLKGFRSITSAKYFYNNRHGFFVGAEFRVKQYSFDDFTDFINNAGNRLNNFNYSAKHTLIGGGIFWGKRFKVSPDGKFELEGNIGIGIKARTIQRNNVPVGYYKEDFFGRRSDIFNPIIDTDINQTIPYVPGIVRFIYHL
jgi:hypothetical protein